MWHTIVVLRLKQQIALLYAKAAQLPVNPLLRYEWSRRDQRRVNERPIEYPFALSCLSELCPSSVLDVGPGTSAWPQLLANCGYNVTAVDEGDSYWRTRPANRHHYVLRDDITHPKLETKFDAITCLSVIEHIQDHQAAGRGLRSLLSPGGHAILSFPYDERRFVDNVYALPGVSYGTDAPYICRVYSRREVDGWLREGFQIVRQEYYRIFSGDLWAFGERLRPPVTTTVNEPHHLTCILFRAT
ncbi:MAG: class I SAM-dependent methyltransferase [Myxococcales bacterium]|nr:class I SAM-dependent methyltransferase [Myxococcales bacterium]MDH3485710.1 class I SAM-dependent methyltransferase [Myxococcales bacterium]